MGRDNMTVVSESIRIKSNCNVRILIVDDNKSLCRSLELIFSKKGYITETAQSGVEALEKANASDFDIAILDLKLPDINGTELLEQFSKSHPAMAIIMATGHASVESAVKALTSQAAAYVTKPIDMDKLLGTVATIYEKQTLLRDKLHAEAALKESEEKYRILAEESPHGIAILQNNRIIYANKAVAAIFGHEVDSLMSMSSEVFWGMIHPTDLDFLFKKYANYEESITTDPRVEFRITRPDGEIRFLEAYATSITSQDAEAIQIMIIDRTSAKKAEEVKELHQKEIDIYNSLLKHDLGNDLQVVMGELEFIKLCTSDLTGEAKQSLESAIAGTERMYNLITALKKPMDAIENRITVLIEQVAKQSEIAHPGLSISLNLGDQVENLRVRGSRLLPMVFVNLFSNAIKYGGKAASVEVTISKDGTHALVEINDDGPGVAPEIQENLFQRGVSTSGGGLGLYLSKRIIEAIGGTIEYIPRLPKGAQFRIAIPLDIQGRS
jgi:PAS domain S-box-containing protein